MRYRALLAIVATTIASVSSAITDQERAVLQRLVAIGSISKLQHISISKPLMSVIGWKQ